jgi:hypothetical protein
MTPQCDSQEQPQFSKERVHKCGSRMHAQPTKREI